jgi:hypothetical protein
MSPIPTTYESLLGSPVAALEVLVSDMIAKQSALERMQHTSDIALLRSDMALWRLKDMSGRNEALAQSVSELRRLLHESHSGAGVLTSKDLSGLSTADLEDRCRQAAARLQVERVKNSELVRRLQARTTSVYETRGACVCACQLVWQAPHLRGGSAAEALLHRAQTLHGLSARGAKLRY